LRQRLSSVAALWHLLSLDAPTVAALWALFFARAMHLHLPIVQALLLALGTWLLYVTDRILDGLRHGGAEWLRERHLFHARHRIAFLSAAVLLASLLAWSVILHMRPEALHDNLGIALCVLLYLYSVHRRTHSAASLAPRLPKELAVAIIFAAATAVPAWSRLGSAGFATGKEQLAPAVLFFAMLCWVNCVGIDKWETRGPVTLAAQPHATTRWASLHLRLIVTIIALFAVAAALLAPSRGLMAVYLAALLSSGLLLVLDARSAHLSPLHLRIAADAALLTPLALFPLAR
jgi:hypothetical protein